jgi:tetratricopeptide (TPR) repeat protein
MRMQKNSPERHPKTTPNVQDQKPIRGWIWVLASFVLFVTAISLGSLGGYYSVIQALKSQQEAMEDIELQTQFNLGIQDLDEGRFEVAKQRFEYIVSINPNYPGVMEKLAISMQVLYSTASPTPPPAEPTATATRDPRPIEELYTLASSFIANQDWDNAIDTLAALRKEDRTYQTPRVDGMLYLAMRSRGVIKIMQSCNLEGGIYDLAQAERFGPLDADASQARQWARLHIIGLSFWEVHPEQAVYYFSQVASALPYLCDGSGWTAQDRYRTALKQYGDLLATNGEWCEAMNQYQLALSIRPDSAMQQAYQDTADRCLALTITPTVSSTSSLTTTVTVTTTPTLPIQLSETPTSSPATATLQIPTSTPTATIIASTPTPTLTQGITPSATDTPQVEETAHPSVLQPAGYTVPMSNFEATQLSGNGFLDMPSIWHEWLQRIINW